MNDLTFFGCAVLRVEPHSDIDRTADIYISIAESPGPLRIDDVSLSDIDGWPTFTNHSRAGCCAGERDRVSLTPTAVAHPDPVEEAGSGTNFKEDR